MNSLNQNLGPQSQIICDKILYQRLQSLEENESIEMHLFPLRRQSNKSFSFVVMDMNKCKINSSEKSKISTKEEFISKCFETLMNEILTFSLTKELICQLLDDNNSELKIVSRETKQTNLMLKDCVLLSLKLPKQFNQNKSFLFSLEGFKFNLVGKIQQNWGFINNGRITKTVLAFENEKIRKLHKQNKVYSKNQLGSILSLIKNVNNLTDFSSQKCKFVEELIGLGQNFIHHQKFISNSNLFLPILSYEIELLCSIGREESCTNKLVNQNRKNSESIVYKVCLNFSEGIQNCQIIVDQKIKAIFSKDISLNPLLSSSQNLLLTSIPTKLVNPHMFLKTQFKEKFSQYYVKGLYEYYHYGDQNFNDQGWGCAYRSLQTLLSWFKIQQKLNLLTVPTIAEIQNLIDLIDCTSQQKLSNTNTWIGATEVSWVVKKLTGFDCRILHIKDGKDIVEHAEMFREHLENVGTPIMYGGDEYAYAIVGINYSWKLGQISFCILDPHYNGNDKIQKVIEKKGICWRKPQQMFKKGVFYNFCLPIL